MRFAAIFALLFITGALLLVYTINSRSLLDWERLDQLLDNKEITTQQATEELVLELYERGVLPEYLEHESIVLLLVAIGFVVLGGFGAIHIVADKLFTKKFYESPEALIALRRGLLLTLSLISLILLFLFNFFLPAPVLAVVVIALVTEYLVSSWQAPLAVSQTTETGKGDSGSGTMSTVSTPNSVHRAQRAPSRGTAQRSHT